MLTHRLDGVTFDGIHQKIVYCYIDAEFCGSRHNHLRSEWHSSYATVGTFLRNTPPTELLIITQSHLIRDFAILGKISRPSSCPSTLL